MEKKIANTYDYRTLRQLINANHDRFSSLNYDDSMSLLHKMDALVEFFKVVLKEFDDVVAYLDEFQKNFDENLYNTTNDILEKWLKDGIISDYLKDLITTYLTIGNIETDFNAIDLNTVSNGKYIVRITNGQIVYGDSAVYSIIQNIPVTNHTKVKFTKNTSTQNPQRFVVHNKSGYAVQNFDENVLQIYINNGVIEQNDTHYIMDIEKLSIYMETGFLTFQYETEKLNNKEIEILMYDYFNEDILTWLDPYNFTHFSSLEDKPSIRYFKENKNYSNVSKKRKYLGVSSVSNNQPVWTKNVKLFTELIPIDEFPVIRFKKPTLTTGQFLLLTNSKGEVFRNLDYNILTGDPLFWFTYDNGDIVIDTKELNFAFRGNDLNQLYIVRNIEDLYNEIEIEKRIFLNDYLESVDYSKNVTKDVHVSKLFKQYVNLDTILTRNYDEKIMTKLPKINGENIEGDNVINGVYQTKYTVDTVLNFSHLLNGFEIDKTDLKIKVMNENVGASKEIVTLTIGDSLGANIDRRTKLNELLGQTPIKNTFIGTLGSDPLKHEAYNGVATPQLVNNPTVGDNNGTPYTNKFYNPATSKFDLAYYLSNNSLPTPDVILIHLGTNDVRLGATVNGSLTAFQFLIDNIKSFNQNIKIIFMYPPFFSAYENTNQYQRNNRETMENLLYNLRHILDNKESQGVYTYETFLNLDYKLDVKTKEVTFSDFSEKTVTVGTDGTHFDVHGFYKIALSDCNAILRAFY